MKKMKMILSVALVLCAVWLTGCSDSVLAKSGLSPKNPVTVTVWHYYNGAQQQAFSDLIEQFNDTRGKELGILVEAVGQGSVTDLEKNVLASAQGKVGASALPNVFAAYADTAYALDQMGLLADINPYLDQAEREKYVDSYWDEGQLNNSSALKIFPIAKSIEVFTVNHTDWEKFRQATGVAEDALEHATMEDITAIAARYYEWTDSLTAAPNDGKAFFGRDALANYMLIGAKQLGMEILQMTDQGIRLNFEKEIVRKLWDNYYVPYINGYFSSAGRFRSDDVKTGTIISFVGSSSGATLFPNEVILSEDTRYPIEMEVYPSPMFAGGEKYAVQQGAGMAVTENEDQRLVYASVEFLRWFTSEERNLDFSVLSGYVPVVKSAYDKAFLTENAAVDEDMKEVIITAIDTVNSSKLYTPKAFQNGTNARNILENAMADQAESDRAAVIQQMAGGMSRQSAAALYDTDANFDRWYEQTKSQLEAVVR